MSPPPVPLPIDAVLPQALAHLRRRRELVVVAPTGSGKTTRLPAALLDAGVAGEGDAVVVLEPRRLAARAAARFVAAERGGALGEEVGYHVRFDRKLGPRTRLRYVTEGLFLRALQADPFLEGVGAVVFDEFHERNLDGDLALALARRVQSEARADLALVVMSATLEAEPVARFLGDAPVVRSEGRSHPVEIEHRPPPSGTPEHEAAARAVRDELARPGGDLLVFLPGVGEIRRLELALADVERSVELVPLYGELDPARQDRALAAGERRRVVLATNVAETSVTVEGVDTVIDTGRVRLLRHDETSGLNRLVPERVSRASADQRAGRAGRLGPGRCVRLWSPWEERALPPVTEPEIRRGELSGVVLELLAFGERDPQAFPWFEAPRPRALESATALLASLGAVRAGTLTELGRRMQRLPVAPRLARLLVEAESLGVLERGALAAALLSERSPFERDWTPQVRAASSDVLERVEVLEAFERGGRPRSFGLRGFREGRARAVLAVRDALLRTLRAAHGGGKAGRHPEARDPDVALGRALFVAFADRLARRREAGSPRAVAIDGRGVQLDPESVVTEAELFVCLERRSAAGVTR